MLVIGVDPHKDSHTLVVVDGAGCKRGQLTVPARQDGHLRAVAWARRLGEPVRWAVEDCRHVAGGLLRDLLAGGESVVAVPPRLMARARASVRQRGKSDPIDALAVARAAQREPELPAARLDEEALELRLLVDHRRALIAERTRIINRLRWHCHALDPDLAPGPRELSRKCVQAKLLGRLAACAVSVRRELALELVADIRALSEKIAALERRLTRQVTPLAPNLLAIPGVGALTAATLVGETAGIDRFASKAAFALHAGAAPIPVWSGNNVRVRLNRGGNRRLNAALHVIALTQLRPEIHPPARALYDRLTAAGKTRPEALRVLKRRLADVVYRSLHHDHQRQAHPDGSSGPPRSGTHPDSPDSQPAPGAGRAVQGGRSPSRSDAAGALDREERSELSTGGRIRHPDPRTSQRPANRSLT
ncbi:IS110 family transposase [Streptomyces sp. TRM 70361]|uniref:IS110 family transposase n=1 Tax=Streptomyces sp. TRM 70361 TaxID=3116553 RepID=UPI002E7B38DC|nr:IS110 family transposase [Streptomyces sp. TRM 70361]MEE1941683.1 IS110 family transposase [Streptomyces sp. TRM 70361]